MKRRYRAIGSITASQQAKQDAHRADGCAACHLRHNKSQPGPTEIHHRNLSDYAGQKQLGHDCVVGLCSWHHRGVILPGYTVATMRDEFGPSLHHHKRDFVNWLQDTLGERSTVALQAFQDARIARKDEAA